MVECLWAWCFIIDTSYFLLLSSFPHVTHAAIRRAVVLAAQVREPLLQQTDVNREFYLFFPFISHVKQLHCASSARVIRIRKQVKEHVLVIPNQGLRNWVRRVVNNQITHVYKLEYIRKLKKACTLFLFFFFFLPSLSSC